jgi:hypothetical protein
MNSPLVKEACRESLMVMKRSLLSSYELGSTLLEEALFVEAWTSGSQPYLVFSDYRRNDGLRRLKDVLDIIDYAILTLEDTSEQSASEVYMKTLRSVSMVKQWASILEASA